MPRGRKKGTKNRPKEVIQREREEKQRIQAEKARAREEKRLAKIKIKEEKKLAKKNKPVTIGFEEVPQAETRRKKMYSLFRENIRISNISFDTEYRANWWAEMEEITNYEVKMLDN